MAQSIEFTMRNGQTVEIKMSSSTAGTGSMISQLFLSLMANCFQTLVAAAAKVLSQNNWMYCGQSASSCLRNAVFLCERQ